MFLFDAVKRETTGSVGQVCKLVEALQHVYQEEEDIRVKARPPNVKNFQEKKIQD